MQYDAIVIGTGQAGPTLASRLAAGGRKTAILERRQFGGTCVNNGCTPTKALVASAKAAHSARRAHEYGIMLGGDIRVDMKKVKARKDELVHQSTTGVENWLRSTENLTVYHGHGRFESPRTVRVNGELLEADQIFINVGGRPYVPDHARGMDYLTNESMMDIDFAPEHLIIIGGSYIGLEFGQMYRRFGSRVTIVEKNDRLVSREDPDISAAIQEILKKEDIELRLSAECISGQKEGDTILVDVECEEGEPQIRGTHLLFATGRTPNTEELGLDKAGVETDDRGYILVNERLETNVPGIYALGDCNRRGAFTHTAYNDHEIVADNLLQGDDRKVTDRILCYGLFIDPPLARIGMNEAEARKSGRNVLMVTREMKRVARAREKGETDGLMKILVDGDTQEILGAAILGVGGDEVIHSILDLMYARKPYTLIQRAVHIHPTVSELIPTMLGDLQPLGA